MRRRSVKEKCDWADCQCMRCQKDCCIEHEDLLCPANLKPEVREKIAQEDGFVLDCPDFIPKEDVQ